jgi:hypothetical protein
MKFTVTYAYFPSHNHVSVMSLTLTLLQVILGQDRQRSTYTVQEGQK